MHVVRRAGIYIVAQEDRLAHESRGTQTDDALQGAEIRDNREFRLAHREARISGAETEVACGHQVDTAAHTAPLHTGDHGLSALLECTERLLQFEDRMVQFD